MTIRLLNTLLYWHFAMINGIDFLLLANIYMRPTNLNTCSYFKLSDFVRYIRVCYYISRLNTQMSNSHCWKYSDAKYITVSPHICIDSTIKSTEYVFVSTTRSIPEPTPYSRKIFNACTRCGRIENCIKRLYSMCHDPSKLAGAREILFSTDYHKLYCLRFKGAIWHMCRGICKTTTIMCKSKRVSSVIRLTLAFQIIVEDLLRVFYRINCLLGLYY